MKSMRSLYADKHNRYWRNEISVNKGNTQGLCEHSTAYWVIPPVTTMVDFAKYYRDAAVRRSTPSDVITGRLHRCHRRRGREIDQLCAE